VKTKIILHGKLAKIYGKEFQFANINKPSDAVLAIDTIFPGFRKHLIRESAGGSHYELICDNDSKTLKDVQEKQRIKIVEIVPCIIGQVELIIGGIIGLFKAGAIQSVFLQQLVVSVSVGLIMAGIMYLLTPIPENEPNEAAISTNIKNNSFLFQTPQNITVQGRPVPIGYGRLRIGSMVVGQNLTNYDLSSDRQNVSYDSLKTEALLKINASFGSSISNYFRGY